MPTVATRQPARNIYWVLPALVFFTTLFIVFVYTFLHEAGHTLAGLAFGQSLTDFNVNFWDLSAHVRLSGPLNPLQHALMSVAGVGFPLLLWTVFISIAPRKANFHVQVLKLIATISVLGTLLAWVFLPFFRLYGNSYVTDDVTRFLHDSQMHPLLLSGLAAALFTVGWALYLSKTGSLRDQFLLFRQADHTMLTNGTRTTIPVMTGSMLACLAITIAINGLVEQNPSLNLNPPDGYQSLEQIDLALQDYTSKTLAQFSIEQASSVGVFFQVEDIEAAYFYLRLVNGDGVDYILLQGEGYRADRNGGLWQETLPPGDYRLLLDSRQSSGKLSTFLNMSPGYGQAIEEK